MNSILPKTLIGRDHAFSTKHIPYAYFTIKFKCFKGAAQQCCNTLIPGTPSPTTDPKAYSPHPAHTCPKKGHSGLRNIMSFKKVPGRAAFKRVGRSFMYGVRQAVPGYGMSDLCKGKHFLDQAIKKQSPRPPTVVAAVFGAGLFSPTLPSTRPMPGKLTK